MAAILIVEDDLTFATMLKTWLGKQGFQISTAGDLSKAHKLLEHQSYDLILSDLRLPEGDGLSLLDCFILSSAKLMDKRCARKRKKVVRC